MQMKVLRYVVAAGMLGALYCGFGAGILAADEKSATPTPTPRPSSGKSLSEVAKEKQLKGTEEGKSIVISNENLAEYSEKGAVTQSGGGSTAGRRPVRPPGSNVKQTDPLNPSNRTDERRNYWQGQYQNQVELVGTLKNQITLLDAEIPGLWREFYTLDDPWYRDGVVKPRLDEAMKRRQRLEEQLAAAEPKLNEIKNSSRQDGGEPGWFRGIAVPTPVAASPTPGVVINNR